MLLSSSDLWSSASRPELCDYVAQLQLHMTLQARNLVPSLSSSSGDSRLELIHESQAALEKAASRQWL